MFKRLFGELGQSIGLLVLRLASGGLMLTHGWSKMSMLFSGNFKFADPLGIGEAASLVLAALAEFVASLFVMAGLGTRIAVIPLWVTMAVAAFIVHGDDPLIRKELALLYLTVYTVLFLTGGGRFSLDALLTARRAAKK